MGVKKHSKYDPPSKTPYTLDVTESRAFKPHEHVVVNQGTGKYVRGQCVQPYWGKLVRIEGGTAYVKKDETNRVCAVPLWSLQKVTQWEMTPININARPSFRRLSSKSKAKICAGADAALRGKLFECETKMRRMEAQYKRNIKGI